MRPAIRLSCAVTPTVTSTINTQRSARRMLRSARITLKTSTELECLPRRRIPAVSMKRSIDRRARKKCRSRRGVVPPATRSRSCRFRPHDRVMSEDLPTFGRPMIAMLGRFSILVLDSRSLKWLRVKALIASRGTIQEMPRPCSALIETALSNPSDAKSVARFSCFGSSILLMTSTIGFRDLRRMRASS